MKRTLLAIALASAASIAGADEYFDPVIVEHVDGYRLVENCTPPTSAPECAGFHAMIRQSFSDQEIAMLFGSATANPAYRTSYSQLRERYDNLVRYVEDNGAVPVPAVSVGTIDTIPVVPVYEDTAYYDGEAPRYEDSDTYYDDDAPVEPRDDDAVILDDDPDAAVLKPARGDLYPNTSPDATVVYYDDNVVASSNP
jgi:hypothetical protein